MKIIIGLMLGVLFITPVIAADGYSTLPGWSIGYQYYFDLNDNEDDKLRLYGKFKQRNGNGIRFGIDMKYRDISNGGALFFQQEFKF